MNFLRGIQPTNRYFKSLAINKFGTSQIKRGNQDFRSLSSSHFSFNSSHLSIIKQSKWKEYTLRSFSSSRNFASVDPIILPEKKDEIKEDPSKQEQLFVLPNSSGSTGKDLISVNEGKEEKEQKKDDEEKDKKKDKKLRMVFVKQMIKYGIQGFLGAIIAWLLGWYPDAIQQQLDGPRVRSNIQSDNDATKLDIGDLYQPRGKLDQNLSALFGSHDKDWAKVIIVIGPTMSGKTWALKNAASEQEMVVWINAASVKTEQEFAQKFYQSIGLWFTPPVLSHAFEFFGKQCRVISSKRADGKVPTLIIEDLNFGNELHQELIQVIMSQVVKLGADKRCCRVILTASDHLIAAPELEHFVNRSGKVKLFEIGDFSTEEASSFLDKGSTALDKHPTRPWRLTDEQKNRIIDQVGEKPGILKSVLEEIDQRVEGDSETISEAVEATIKGHTKRAEMIVDAAFSLFPESESPLKKWAKEGWKIGKTASQARKLFGFSPEDKEGKLFKVLMDQKRILTWNASNGMVKIASKPLWNNLKDK